MIPSERTLARLDRVSWILIYVGLFMLVLGIASHDETLVGGWSLSVLGVVATVVGIVMIVVRARLGEPPVDPAAKQMEKRQ